MPTVVFTGGFMILLFGIIILFSIIDKNGLDLEDLKGITSKILLTLRGKNTFINFLLNTFLTEEMMKLKEFLMEMQKNGIKDT